MSLEMIRAAYSGRDIKITNPDGKMFYVFAQVGDSPVGELIGSGETFNAAIAKATLSLAKMSVDTKWGRPSTHPEKRSLEFIQPSYVKGRDPVVSIIVGCYKQCAYLKEALKSAETQDFQYDYEVIAYHDNCKTYGSGISVARNLSLQRAKGKYVVFLDADDIMPANYISTLYAGAASLDWDDKSRTPKSVISCPNYFFQSTGTLTPLFAGNGGYYDGLTSLRKRDIRFAGPCSASMWPLWVWKDGTHFDENLTVAEDTDFYLQLANRGFQFYHTLKTTLLRRNLSDSNFNRANQSEIDKFLTKHPDAIWPVKV
jgi:hypothetical protein